MPLGSIIYLKDGTKKLMIIARGLLVKTGIDDKRSFFDYGGVAYPEGLQGDEMAYFQHEAIAKVVFEGFHDLDDEMIVERINTFIADHPELDRGEANYDDPMEISD